jgi:hypothetical protein
MKAIRQDNDFAHAFGEHSGLAGAKRSSGAAPLQDLALEKHYSATDLSRLWGLSEKTIRRLFINEPGVVKLGREETRFKRAYVTLRIPESVVQRVHRRVREVG